LVSAEVKIRPKSKREFMLIALAVCATPLLLLAPLISDHIKAREAHQQWRERMTVTQVLLLALENYQIREGDYPKRLSDLDIQLGSIENDPYLAKGLARYSYEKLADGGFELKCDGSSVTKRSNPQLSATH
jgi:hypothetical protein